MGGESAASFAPPSVLHYEFRVRRGLIVVALVFPHVPDNDCTVSDTHPSHGLCVIEKGLVMTEHEILMPSLHLTW